MYIIPVVKVLKKRPGKFDIMRQQRADFQAFGDDSRLFKHLSLLFKLSENVDCPPTVIFNQDKALSKQAYKLIIEQDQITITAGSEVGAFYAVMSLAQIIHQSGTLLDNVEIFDEPDLMVRGVMLDISRSKVMTLEQVKKIIEHLALLKYNHLQLYVEGFSFEYQSMKAVNADGNHLTLAEYLAIEEYCELHYIDFVPNQNGFGHMTEWLNLKEYQHLRMVDELFYIWGSYRPSSTLNPLDVGSVELVKKMYADMLPHFKSAYFNMNFDEPFELGYGKSAKACQETSVGQVYVTFLNKMIEEVRKYGKIPMLWGDVLINEPSAIDLLPKDAIFIDWGYNLDYPFDRNLALLKEKGVKFMAAPGTSTWGIVTSRYCDMLWSIKNAVTHTIKNNGLGVLVTDWGDLGHLQYLPYSYLGLTYGALCAWNNEQSYEPLIKQFVARYLLKDYELTSLMIELSRYNEIEKNYRSYGSKLFIPILYAEHMENAEKPMEHFKRSVGLNLLSDEEIRQYTIFLDSMMLRVNAIKESLEQAEIKNSILLLQGLKSFHVMIKQYITNQTSLDQISDAEKLLTAFIKEHARLWVPRNKEAGLLYSTKRIKKLLNVIEEIKKEVKKDD